MMVGAASAAAVVRTNVRRERVLTIPNATVSGRGLFPVINGTTGANSADGVAWFRKSAFVAGGPGKLNQPSRDYSGIGILLSNAPAIVVAMIQNWNLGPLLVVSWVQSVTIGVFNFHRMMRKGS